MFDLPDPFGPTITDTPGEKSSRVRSGNDLKPLSLSERRCTGLALLLLVEGIERPQGSLLLRALLRAPLAAPDRAAGRLRDRHEAAVVRGPRLVLDAIRHDLR